MSIKTSHFAAAMAAALVSCDAPLQEQYVLASQSSLPEGVAYDAKSQTFFATAMRGGQITRVSPLGQEHVFYSHADAGVSLVGADVDEARRRLWVCVVDLRGEYPASKVVALDIEEPAVVRSVDLGPGSYCNDLVADADGSVYASDSALPNIYRVDPGAQTFEVFATDPRFAPAVPGQLGLNGLDLSPDGTSLLVVKTARPELFRVDLEDPRDIVAVSLSGDAFSVPGDPRFPGPDGAEFVGDALYVAFDGGVQQIEFTGQGYLNGRVRTETALPTGLSSLTATDDGRLYAIDSEVYRVLYTSRPPELPFRIVHVDLGAFDEP